MMFLLVYFHILKSSLLPVYVQYNTTIKQYSVVINFIRREFVAIFLVYPFLSTTVQSLGQPGLTWINLDQPGPKWRPYKMQVKPLKKCSFLSKLS